MVVVMDIVVGIVIDVAVCRYRYALSRASVMNKKVANFGLVVFYI